MKPVLCGQELEVRDRVLLQYTQGPDSTTKVVSRVIDVDNFFSYWVILSRSYL